MIIYAATGTICRPTPSKPMRPRADQNQLAAASASSTRPTSRWKPALDAGAPGAHRQVSGTPRGGLPDSGARSEADLISCAGGHPRRAGQDEGSAGGGQPDDGCAGSVCPGGDMVPSRRTVTIATGHGKKAARHMDAWLRGRHPKPLSRYSLVGPEQLQLWFQTHAPPAAQPVNRRGRRMTLARSSAGWMSVAARYEAARCLVPAATASSATVAGQLGRRHRQSWARAKGIRWMPSAAPVAVPATPVPDPPSSWRQPEVQQ